MWRLSGLVGPVLYVEMHILDRGRGRRLAICEWFVIFRLSPVGFQELCIHMKLWFCGINIIDQEQMAEASGNVETYCKYLSDKFVLKTHVYFNHFSVVVYPDAEMNH